MGVQAVLPSCLSQVKTHTNSQGSLTPSLNQVDATAPEREIHQSNTSWASPASKAPLSSSSTTKCPLAAPVETHTSTHNPRHSCPTTKSGLPTTPHP